MSDLLIEGDPEDLAGLMRAIEAELGPDARLFPLTEGRPDVLSEPILIGLIVALGGPVLTKAIADVIKRYMQHRETMAKLRNEFTLAVKGADGVDRPTTLAELDSDQP